MGLSKLDPCGEDLHKNKTKGSQRVKNDHLLKSGVFVKACELAGIKATRRQASKYSKGRGLAWLEQYQAKKQLAEAGK